MQRRKEGKMWQCKCWLSLQTHTCILNSLTTGNNSPLVCYIYLGWLSWISTLYQYSRNFFNSITSENIGGNLLDNELFGILGERLWQKVKLVCNTFLGNTENLHNTFVVILQWQKLPVKNICCQIWVLVSGCIIVYQILYILNFDMPKKITQQLFIAYF